MIFGGFRDVNASVGCFSALISDGVAIIHRDFEELRRFMMSVGCPSTHISTIHKHKTREEAEQRCSASNWRVVTRMELVDAAGVFARSHHSRGGSARPDGIPRALTPRARALSRVARQSEVVLEREREMDDPAELLPTYLSLVVDLKKYPCMDMSLVEGNGVVYARASGIKVRPEWRNVRGALIRQACCLIDALHTDFGLMVQGVMIPSKSLLHVLSTSIPKWRMNAGRNSKNQVPDGYDRLDELKTLIDARKLVTFLPRRDQPRIATSSGVRGAGTVAEAVRRDDAVGEAVRRDDAAGEAVDEEEAEP